MKPLDETIAQLTLLHAEWEKKWQEAEAKRDAAKKESDYWYQRFMSAKNNLDRLNDLRQLMEDEGGGQ